MFDILDRIGIYSAFVSDDEPGALHSGEEREQLLLVLPPQVRLSRQRLELPATRSAFSCLLARMDGWNPKTGARMRILSLFEKHQTWGGKEEEEAKTPTKPFDV